MRQLTNIEVATVSGGVDGWRAAFDVAAGGLIGGAAGGVISYATYTVPAGLEGLLMLVVGEPLAICLGGIIIGAGVGMAAGGLYAFAREKMF
ncbi:MAG: hypothetical protein HYX61_04785 [Gammaproteobacteria bacterium]|nr:hypothetical protein [Gammaproteobacteria bacterium]